ncbi:hypothetical protein [Longimicrobium sp.]|uniref:hypothetical protein n=1 Tax=Longimicrobium sp. TaxID=2029185 RepID=UPI002B89D8FD|nr:hypothetical protein [Longimicrobium sp.]HSU13954.1 hypothetical protein [Longimicrobium sp.]
MRSPALRVIAAAALLVAAAGCNDTVTSGDAPRTPAGRAGGLIDGLLVSVVQRTLPLQQNYTATATIGSAGGTIAIPQAGFRITFPAGAVSAPVTVRATALAGSNVAYEFEPHGIVFAREPVISQDLGLTSVLGQLLSTPLQGGYFADASLLGDGVATISETRPATLDLLRLRTTFTIRHFSGYAVTRKSGYMGASGSRMAGGR